MLCVGGGRESFSGRAAAVWTDHDAAPRRRPILSRRARARILSDLKSDYGVRAITGRSRRSARSYVGLPYASSEMRPNLFAFYRAGGDVILARAHIATLRTIERALARARCGAAACVTSRSRALVPSLKAKGEGRENLSRARDAVWWIAGPTACPSPRGLSSVCVFFNTHWGPARRVVYSVLSSRSRLGFVLLSPPRALCDNREDDSTNRRSITAGGTVCGGSKRDHNKPRPAFHFERLKTQNGVKEGNRACARGNTLITTTSEQARLPAEFKHIIKRRKRN